MEQSALTKHKENSADMMLPLEKVFVVKSQNLNKTKHFAVSGIMADHEYDLKIQQNETYLCSRSRTLRENKELSLLIEAVSSASTENREEVEYCRVIIR